MYKYDKKISNYIIVAEYLLQKKTIASESFEYLYFQSDDSLWNLYQYRNLERKSLYIRSSIFYIYQI